MHRMTRMSALAAPLIGALALATAGSTLHAQLAADPQKTVDAAYAKFKDLREGKNADYIPALAKVDPNQGSSSDEVWKKIIGFHNDAAGRDPSRYSSSGRRFHLPRDRRSTRGTSC